MTDPLYKRSQLTNTVRRVDGNELRMLIAPTVNLNGTSYESLLDDARGVLDALRELDRVLAEAAPHGRDYQTAPEGTYQHARDAWAERRELIDRMREEFRSYAIQISDQR